MLESNLATKERVQGNKKLFDSTSTDNTDSATRLSGSEGGLHAPSAHAMRPMIASDDDDIGISVADATLDGSQAGASLRREQSFTNDVELIKKRREEADEGEIWVLERRAAEAERRAVAAEMRAAEAERRVLVAEGKVADVEKWSCVLQAAMDSATDRAKYWEDRATRLEKLLAKASASLGKQGSPPLVVVEAVEANGGEDIDGLHGRGVVGHRNGVMGHRNGDMGDCVGVMGDHGGVMGDRGGVMGDHDGVMGDRDGVMGDRGGVMGDHDGVTGDRGGVMGDHDGSVVQGADRADAGATISQRGGDGGQPDIFNRSEEKSGMKSGKGTASEGMGAGQLAVGESRAIGGVKIDSEGDKLLNGYEILQSDSFEANYDTIRSLHLKPSATEVTKL